MLVTAGLLAAIMLNGQPCLPSGIVFTTQEAIDSFPLNYPGCTQITGNVQINGPGIINLATLAQIKDIAGSLAVFGNPLLSNLNGLHNVVSIGGTLSFATNPLLSDCSGLNALRTIGGDLLINYSQFSNLSGLNSLIHLGGNMEITVSDLQSLEGLGGLSNTEGNIFISGNPYLQNLDGLSALRMIIGSLVIQYCNSLQSLTGLDSLNPGKITKMVFTDNANLKECDVYSVCRYLDIPDNVTEISNNLDGCNTVEEVQAECDLTALSEADASAILLCFPNPTSGITTFTLPHPMSDSGTITLSDMTGRCKLVRIIDSGYITLDLHELPEGVYLLSAATKSGIARGKIVKQSVE